MQVTIALVFAAIFGAAMSMSVQHSPSNDEVEVNLNEMGNEIE
jgi:hypothetical protein